MSFATVHTTLNAREAEISVREAELAASQNFSDFALQEKLKQLHAEAEAELTDRFTALEAKEESIAARETAIVEREKQCDFLLKKVSKKTAELVLAKEKLFIERFDGMLKAVMAEFASLRRALDERGIDDAKRGEGKKVTPSSEAGGSKDVVVYQDKPKRAVPKLLTASTSAAAAHKARVTAAADAASLNVDATLASTLEAMQSFLLADEGVMEIPQVKPTQAVPSEAAVPTAPLKSLTAPPAKTQAKATPPKTTPAKTSTKRPAPASKEADPTPSARRFKQVLQQKRLA